MYPTIRFSALMSLGLAAMACRADPAAIETESSPAAAIRPATPQEAGVFRFEDFFFLIARDEEAGLISIQGLRNSVAELCADLGDLDLAQFQLKLHTAGEVNAVLYDRESPVQILALEPDQLLCRDLLDAPVLYRGTAAFRRVDNNFTPSGTEGGRADSFGWSAHGLLEEVSTGRPVNYQEVVRLEIDPQTEVQRVLVSRIGVQ
jgi:hypothetical protein